MSFRGTKVLVAGGTGLIGIPLVELLLAEGATVRVASLDDPARAHPDVEFMSMNLLDMANCRLACRRMDTVFNLLGVKGSPKVTTTRPASFLVNTLYLELNMLEAARLEGVNRFVHASSIGVYHPSPLMREDDVWSTFPSKNDWYGGWAKRVGELQVDAYKTEYGWKDIVSVRPANCYGPWDNFDFENAMVVPSLIKRVVDGENPLRVWGDGRPVRDFIHARDVARAMLVVAEYMPPHPMNIGSGQGASIRQLVEAILGHLDDPPEVIYDTAMPAGDPVRVLDVTRLRSLGFEPAISLSDGVRETMDWYRERRASTANRYDVFAQAGESRP